MYILPCHMAISYIILLHPFCTDSIVCHMTCSYVLLHHVMGELEGKKNAWGYAEGGMGGVSQSIARAAKSYGATLHTNCVSIHIITVSMFSALK